MSGDRQPQNTPQNMAHEYLVIFQYREPEPLQLFERGVAEDYESTTGVFINAESDEEALIWSGAIAQERLRYCNGDRSLDWKYMGYTNWIESNPEKLPWSHCLSFFSMPRSVKCQTSTQWALLRMPVGRIIRRLTLMKRPLRRKRNGPS